MFRRASSLIRQVRTIRPDTFAALSIFVGCSFILGEAYTRTDLADAQTAADAEYGPTNDLITSAHVRTLERDGVVVIPDALSRKGLIDARSDIAQYEADARDSSSSSSSRGSGTFERSGVGGESSADGEAHAVGTVRRDLVSWIRPSPCTSILGEEKNTCNEEPAIGSSLAHCIDLIRGVASTLSHFNYTDSHSHRVPLQCQLACYKGDGRSGYARHLDRCSSSLQELGLLEFLRLSDFRRRAVTVILYLNEPERTKEDGGALRCWLKNVGNGRTDTSSKDITFGAPFDIQPTGGSLLIFHSDRVEHQVLPSFKDRYAMTVWINGDLV